MTDEEQRQTLKKLSLSIMDYIDEFCHEHKIEDADIILTAIGIAMSCLIDGSYSPEDRIVQAKKAASVLVRCAETGLKEEEMLH